MTDNDIIRSAVQLVDEGMEVTFPVKGQSMLPFIVGDRDSVVLVRPELLRLNDVVLAWIPAPAGLADGSQPAGRFVVHRIIKMEGDRLTLMGDGNIVGTERCTLADVKARVAYVVDGNGRRHDVGNRWRRLAVRAWRWLRPARRYILAIYRRL